MTLTNFSMLQYIPIDINNSKLQARKMTVRPVEERLSVVEQSLVNYSRDSAEMKTAIVMLVRIEERQAEQKEDFKAVLETVKGQESRLRVIESQLPQLVETRGYILKAVVGALGLLGAAIIGLVLTIKPH